MAQSGERRLLPERRRQRATGGRGAKRAGSRERVLAKCTDYSRTLALPVAGCARNGSGARPDWSNAHAFARRWSSRPTWRRRPISLPVQR
jgi:hypothetical protein